MMPEVGLGWGQTMIFLQTADNKGQIQIEVKDGRYRVTASDFVSHHTSMTRVFKGVFDPIELYLIKKNGDVRPKQFAQTKLLFDAILSEVSSGKAEPLVDLTDDL